MERQFAAGDGWRVRVLALACVVLVCRALGGVVCDCFEGCSCAGVSCEWGERAACGGEPVGVEGNVFVGFDVEEVRPADSERAVFVGEFDHLLWRVGGVAGGDCGGVAVFVWDHVAFLELAECGPFPGAPILVGDVLVIVVGAHVPRGRVVCSCHLCSPFAFSYLFLACSRFSRPACLPRVFPARVFFPAV